MPPPTERQKQAKQHASSSRWFDNRLIEDVLEVSLDPDYVPLSDLESEVDLSLTLMEHCHSVS
jgi:hypothetical protein